MRSGQYVTKRIFRLTASPHAISAGVAAGVFASFTPFMGLHFMIAFVLAYLVAGNMIAAALGTFFGNPLSFPLIWIATYATGNFALGSAVDTLDIGHQLVTATSDLMDSLWALDWHAVTAALDEIWSPLLKPMTVGGAILGIPTGLVSYFITRRAAGFFREARRRKMLARARAVREAAKAGRSPELGQHV
jgi:uncharacterized protein (DUF2062 family)